jgi:hypothetical protein
VLSYPKLPEPKILLGKPSVIKVLHGPFDYFIFVLQVVGQKSEPFWKVKEGRRFRLGRTVKQVAQVQDNAPTVLLFGFDLELFPVFLEKMGLVSREKVDEIGGPITAYPAVSQEIIRSDDQFPLLEIVFLVSTNRTDHRGVETLVRERCRPESPLNEFDDLALCMHRT